MLEKAAALKALNQAHKKMEQRQKALDVAEVEYQEAMDAYWGICLAENVVRFQESSRG